MLLQQENRLFKRGVLQLAMTQWHLVSILFKKHGVNTVEPICNNIGLLRDFVRSVRYFVVPVNSSLLIITILCYNNTRSQRHRIFSSFLTRYEDNSYQPQLSLLICCMVLMRLVSAYESNHNQADETPVRNYVNRIVLFIVIQIHSDI